MASEKTKLIDNKTDSKEFRESYTHNRPEPQDSVPVCRPMTQQQSDQSDQEKKTILPNK